MLLSHRKVFYYFVLFFLFSVRNIHTKFKHIQANEQIRFGYGFKVEKINVFFFVIECFDNGKVSGNNLTVKKSNMNCKNDHLTSFCFVFYFCYCFRSFRCK